MYIAFEGVVGTGKSTQSKRLVTHLQQQFPDREVKRVREPGGTPIAEAIRTVVQATKFDEEMHALTDAYLYASSRAQLINTEIARVLSGGGIVISDRTFCSSLAYQGYAQGLGIERVRRINQEAVGKYIPDMVLYLTLDLDVALARIFDVQGDKREAKKKDFFATVAEGFDAVGQLPFLQDKRQTIDASGSLEEVETKIQKAIASLYTNQAGLRTAAISQNTLQH